MALGDLLYRCPLCGEDPVESRSDLVWCPTCDTRFEPAPPTGESRVRVIRNGTIVDAQTVLLNRRIEQLGGAASSALQPDGTLRASAKVEAQFVADEAPLRFRRRLLGFIERLDDTVWGELRLDDDFLELHPPPGSTGHTREGRASIPRRASRGSVREPGDPQVPGTVSPPWKPRRPGTPLHRVHRWALDDVDSLQTSSSSVQLSFGATGVVLFRFPDESVRRWDDLIRRALRRRWRAMGRGEIIEFQPRLRSR